MWNEIVKANWTRASVSAVKLSYMDDAFRFEQ